MSNDPLTQETPLDQSLAGLTQANAVSIDKAGRHDLVHLIMRHQSFIKAYALVILRDLHMAEDTLQEVCLILAQDWERVPAGLPMPWLKEVIRRKAMDVARRTRRHVLLSPEVLIAVGDAFPAPTEGGEENLRNAMIDCVRKLSGNVRNVIEARYGDGKSCEQIATTIGRSVQGVYAILKRARVTLSDCVKRIEPTVIREVDNA
jgi:RNA polymerase sigma-70 factor, ECF subfamily